MRGQLLAQAALYPEKVTLHTIFGFTPHLLVLTHHNFSMYSSNIVISENNQL
jgi:hypothetical protein